jgi:hypothetical protein
MRAFKWESERSCPTTLPSGVLGLVLSILLVVLVSGAVLWVVDGEQDKPTSEAADAPSEAAAIACASDGGGVVDPAVDAALATIPHLPAARPRPRQPATSRRVVPVPVESLPEPEWRDAPVAPVAVAAPATVTPLPLLPPVRTLDPPLPRHRLRSALLLVALVVAAGALVATVIGVIVGALALALRAAVTS